MKTHFELFGLEPGFAMEIEALELVYREIQGRVHPDRYAGAGEAERRASMQWTTRVDEAYRTLKDPVQRASYLLRLNGVEVAFETNTAMPTEFLVRQMELREALEMAAAEKDAGALERLRAGLRQDKRALEAALAERIDAQKDYVGAAELARKLKFLARFDDEIDAAFQEMEG